MAAWDYKTVKGITEREMNELGHEGWELVKVDSLEGIAIFKRRHHYPPIPRNWTGKGSWGGSWGRKHPDD